MCHERVTSLVRLDYPCDILLKQSREKTKKERTI